MIIGAAGAYAALKFLDFTFTLERPTVPLVELLPNAEYVRGVSKLIEGASRSVYVAVFVMKYDLGESPGRDPANALIELLVEAKSRGLDVRVIVDDTTKRNYPETIEYLKSRDVPIRLDPGAGVTMHSKIVIVDGVCAIIGSHNWTEAALSLNNEFSVLICSEETVRDIESYFIELWNNGRPG